MQDHHPEEHHRRYDQRQQVSRQQHPDFCVRRTHRANLRLRRAGSNKILIINVAQASRLPRVKFAGETPALLQTRRQPIKVSFIARAHWQNDKLRRVVGMFGEDQFLQRGQLRFLRLQNQQHLRTGLNLSLPPVMRFDFWDEIRAGDQPRRQRGFGQRAGRLQIRRGDEDDGESICRHIGADFVVTSNIVQSFCDHVS